MTIFMYRLVLGIVFSCFCGQTEVKSASHMYVFPPTTVTSSPTVLLNYPFFVIFFSLFFSSHWIFYFPFSFTAIFFMCILDLLLLKFLGDLTKFMSLTSSQVCGLKHISYPLFDVLL